VPHRGGTHFVWLLGREVSDLRGPSGIALSFTANRKTPRATLNVPKTGRCSLGVCFHYTGLNNFKKQALEFFFSFDQWASDYVHLDGSANVCSLIIQ